MSSSAVLLCDSCSRSCAWQRSASSASFLAAPAFGSETAAVIQTFRHDLWRLASSACDAEEGESESDERRALGDAAAAVGNGATGAAPPSSWLSFGNFVHLAILVSCLELVLTVGGIALALLPFEEAAAKTAELEAECKV